MSEIFKIRVDGFKEIKKQLLFKSLPILLISMAFGLGIAFFNTKDKEDLVTILPIMIPFFVLTLGYGIHKGLKRQKLLFDSYKLLFSENSVIREQINTPTITILLNDIKSIIKDKKGSYTIKGKTNSETIFIPVQIENHEKLELVFNKIKPIESFNKPTFEEKYKTPILLLTLVCMATVYISDNKILVGISGLLVSVLLINSFIKIKNNNNIDNKTKRIGIYSLLVLVSIIFVTIIKITAN
jgi:hypothetical protein